MILDYISAVICFYFPGLENREVIEFSGLDLTLSA